MVRNPWRMRVWSSQSRIRMESVMGLPFFKREIVTSIIIVKDVLSVNASCSLCQKTCHAVSASHAGKTFHPPDTITHHGLSMGSSPVVEMIPALLFSPQERTWFLVGREPAYPHTGTEALPSGTD